MLVMFVEYPKTRRVVISRSFLCLSFLVVEQLHVLAMSIKEKNGRRCT